MKSKRWDQEYLLKEQYHNASNLSARAQLHARFSTNKQGWHRWVFDQLDLPPDARVLELGGGPAWLWRENLDRIPEGWDITLSDFSPGMVAEAQQHLSESGCAFTFRQIDAQVIPFDSATFDAVIANHMLYHVPDRKTALAEIFRVLKPGGRFYAATNGTKHLKEIRELIQEFAPHTYDAKTTQDAMDVFTLENGADLIGQFFAQVTMTRYEDALVVTEVEPLLDYILSGIVARDSISADQIATFGQFLADQMKATGAILITKDAGLFEARR
jgi:ubiquinone/menaquinone biosynthesis C-methylase UbiE